MFSGKSSELIRRLKRHQAVGKRVLVVNSAKDTRNDSCVLQTHDGVTFDCIKSGDLLAAACSGKFAEADVVAVDECQFFKGLRPFVERALDRGKRVILAGLDGDYRQAVFGELLTLVPLADEVVKLSALCMECRDGTPGPFSKRICEGADQELVGAADKYQAVCRKHIAKTV